MKKLWKGYARTHLFTTMDEKRETFYFYSHFAFSHNIFFFPSSPLKKFHIRKKYGCLNFEGKFLSKSSKTLEKGT